MSFKEKFKKAANRTKTFVKDHAVQIAGAALIGAVGTYAYKKMRRPYVDYEGVRVYDGDGLYLPDGQLVGTFKYDKETNTMELDGLDTLEVDEIEEAV